MEDLKQMIEEKKMRNEKFRTFKGAFHVLQREPVRQIYTVFSNNMVGYLE
ncbi:MAG: hypothetical protein ACN4GW_15550 [Desulforhopalus sp.]